MREEANDRAAREAREKEVARVTDEHDRVVAAYRKASDELFAHGCESRQKLILLASKRDRQRNGLLVNNN